MFNIDMIFLELRSKDNIDLIKSADKCVLIKNNLSKFFSESQLVVEKNAFSMRSKDGLLDCTIFGNRIVINCRNEKMFYDAIKSTIKEILSVLKFKIIERIGIRSYNIKEYPDKDSVSEALMSNFANPVNFNIFGKDISNLNFKFNAVKNNGLNINISLFSSVMMQEEINISEHTHNTKQTNVIVADLDYYTLYNREIQNKDFLFFVEEMDKERKRNLKELERILGD